MQPIVNMYEFSTTQNVILPVTVSKEYMYTLDGTDPCHFWLPKLCLYITEKLYPSRIISIGITIP